MSIQTCAAASLSTWSMGVSVATPQGSLPLPVVMVAIAGAESGWVSTAAGDAGLDAGYGLCNGYSSWGLWQIHNVHASYLTQVTGSQSPCAWAQWLSSPVHNAQAAEALTGSSPSSAALASTWTTYANGSWAASIPAAQAAVSQALAATAPRVSTPSGGLLAAPAGGALIAVGALAGLVLVLEAGVYEAVKGLVAGHSRGRSVPM